jgi:hypothetical protein
MGHLRCRPVGLQSRATIISCALTIRTGSECSYFAGKTRAVGARLGDQFLGQGSAGSAVPIPRRRRLALLGFNDGIKKFDELFLAGAPTLTSRPCRGAGPPAAAAGRISGFDLQKPARHRPPVLRDGFAGSPAGAGIGRPATSRLGTACRGPKRRCWSKYHSLPAGTRLDEDATVPLWLGETFLGAQGGVVYGLRSAAA